MWGNQQKDRSFFPQENMQDKVKTSKEMAFCPSTSAGMRSSGRHSRVCGRSQGLNAMVGYLPPPKDQHPAKKLGHCPAEGVSRTWL